MVFSHSLSLSFSLSCTTRFLEEFNFNTEFCKVKKKKRESLLCFVSIFIGREKEF